MEPYKAVIHTDFEARKNWRVTFLNSDAAADATVETPMPNEQCADCNARFAQAMKSGGYITCDKHRHRPNTITYSNDLSAMQPVADYSACRDCVACNHAVNGPNSPTDSPWCRKHLDEAHEAIKRAHPDWVYVNGTLTPSAASNALPIQQAVNVTTGNAAARGQAESGDASRDADGNPINRLVFKPQMIKRGVVKIDGAIYPEGTYIPFIDIVQQMNRRVSDPVIAAEEISVKWQKRDDLDAAMLKECRAALAKLREWPRCKDHDQPMSVRCCLPFVGNGKRYAFAGCSEIGCRRASSPVEIELTGPTGRAIGDESWIAPEHRE